MKIKAIILIFFFLFPAFAGINAVTDEGYGETETALGQFVDSFETSNNVSTAVNVIRNTTLEVMELNGSGGSVHANENFTDYTEVDANNKITVFSDRIEFIILRRDDGGWVSYDYGVNYFADFEVEFTVKINDTEAGDSSQRWISAIVTVCSYAQDYGGKPGGSDGVYVMIRDNGAVDNSYKFTIFGLKNGATLPGVEDIGKVRAVSNDELYLRLNRTDDDLYLWVYTDADYSTLDETLTLPNTGFSDPMQYIHGIQSIDSATDGDIWMSGYVKDLWLGNFSGGYEPEGYFTTTNYMNDPTVNGEALTQLTNTSIPANTIISVEFSDDNSSWTGTTTLVDGFQSVDLRGLGLTDVFLRYNLSTTDQELTPRVYQSRLITTVGNETISEQNVTGSWIEYNLTEFNATVGTVDAGLLSSTFSVDGNTFDVSEVVGVPGMMLSGNFSGVDEDAISLWLLIYAYYDGNLNHDFDIEVWNFEGSVWVEDNHILDGVALEWFNSTIYPIRVPNDFLSNGEVRIRLDHESAGNINHDLFIDLIQLQAFIPSAAAGEPFQFFWIVIGIALMIIGIVLARMWPEEGDP